MSANLIKSSLQLKYELDNTKNELATLHSNWKKKKEESLSRIVNFRSALKEIDAVIAANEESYKSYCALVKQVFDVLKPVSHYSPVNLSQSESLHPELTLDLTARISQVLDFTRAAEAAEAMWIERARTEHQTQSVHMQRKSKDIYTFLNEEKNTTDVYASVLQSKIQELEAQYLLQTEN